MTNPTRVVFDPTKLTVDVSNVITDVSNVKTDVSDLKTDVSDLKTDVSDLKTDVSNVKTDVSNVKTDVSNVKTDVSNLIIDVSLNNDLTERILKDNMNEVKDIKFGELQTIILTTNGRVLGMGDNSDQSITSNLSQKTTLYGLAQIDGVLPLISDPDKFAVGIDCGINFTAIVYSDGTATVFGNNDKGQTSIPSEHLTNVKQIACGDYYTMILTNNNELYGYGDNSMKQLGSNSVGVDIVPIIKNSLNNSSLEVNKVECGSEHTVLLMNNDRIIAFGNNDSGQCGSGTPNDIIELSNITDFINIGYKPMYNLSDGNIDTGIYYLDQNNISTLDGENKLQHLIVVDIQASDKNTLIECNRKNYKLLGSNKAGLIEGTPIALLTSDELATTNQTYGRSSDTIGNYLPYIRDTLNKMQYMQNPESEECGCPVKTLINNYTVTSTTIYNWIDGEPNSEIYKGTYTEVVTGYFESFIYNFIKYDKTNPMYAAILEDVSNGVIDINEDDNFKFLIKNTSTNYYNMSKEKFDLSVNVMPQISPNYYKHVKLGNNKLFFIHGGGYVLSRGINIGGDLFKDSAAGVFSEGFYGSFLGISVIRESLSNFSMFNNCDDAVVLNKLTGYHYFTARFLNYTTTTKKVNLISESESLDFNIIEKPLSSSQSIDTPRIKYVSFKIYYTTRDITVDKEAIAEHLTNNPEYIIINKIQGMNDRFRKYNNSTQTKSAYKFKVEPANVDSNLFEQKITVAEINVSLPIDEDGYKVPSTFDGSAFMNTFLCDRCAGFSIEIPFLNYISKEIGGISLGATEEIREQILRTGMTVVYFDEGIDLSNNRILTSYISRLLGLPPEDKLPINGFTRDERDLSEFQLLDNVFTGRKHSVAVSANKKQLYLGGGNINHTDKIINDPNDVYGTIIFTTNGRGTTNIRSSFEKNSYFTELPLNNNNINFMTNYFDGSEYSEYGKYKVKDNRVYSITGQSSLAIIPRFRIYTFKKIFDSYDINVYPIYKNTYLSCNINGLLNDNGFPDNISVSRDSLINVHVYFYKQSGDNREVVAMTILQMDVSDRDTFVYFNDAVDVLEQNFITTIKDNINSDISNIQLDSQTYNVTMTDITRFQSNTPLDLNNVEIIPEARYNYNGVLVGYPFNINGKAVNLDAEMFKTQNNNTLVLI